VLGQFPDRSDDSLIPLSWVERARERTLVPEEEAVLGVDVARRGSSETVIMLRRGVVARCVWARVGEDTMRTTGEVIKALRTHWARVAKVDDVGVGGGVVDRLREQGHPAVGLNGGRRPRDRRRFVNARAEWYWGLRERFEHGEIDIDPEDEVLAEQLCSIRYGVDSAGRIQIESKEDMRARGIASPDRADALALAFAEVELRAQARVKRMVIRL
jgi:phage terminase large subunit